MNRTKQNPKVSVIIPFYNNFQWLSEAINSVIAQTYQDFEIIVINDGSLEDDTHFLENFSNSIQYLKVTNGGPARARNMGIRLAKGKFIAFLDSDDLWLPEKLSKQVAFMEENDVNWSHTSYFIFNEGEEGTLQIKDVSNFRGNVFPKSLVHLNIGTPCVMVRSDYLNDNSFLRFSENMRYGQDGYLWILLSIKNCLGVIEEPLTKVRRTGGNAVLRARVHLEVKAGLDQNLIPKLKTLFPYENVDQGLKVVYRYCFWSKKLIDYLDFRVIKNKNSGILELLSKAFYVPAFLYFKLKAFTL